MLWFTVAMVYWILGWLALAYILRLLNPKENEGHDWFFKCFGNNMAVVGLTWLVMFWALHVFALLP